MARFPTVIKFFNIASYLLLATLVSEPEFRFEYHNSYIHPNFFVFYFWNLIQWLLGFFLFYQFIDLANETIVDGIGWLFVGSALLNSVWLVLVVFDYLILAWLAILIVSIQLSLIYYNLKYKYPPQNRFDTYFIHLPFNIYHAWVIVISVISLFISFIPDKDSDSQPLPGFVIQICSVIALVILDLVAMGYIYKGKGDFVGSGVIVISLFGIALQQGDVIIHWVALGLGIKTTILMIIYYIKKFYRRNEEQIPLLV
ncbi:22734_t:CDS:2 [Cetraspora pellucida]|uniref:22734_t:CDS:1 n=1 Tax=Cetraspora pellucida TaxID=1433469 RepID=A0A9N9AQD9_9GLOM|nr:22734_t:CDS:2 [Cetraspora pellucida]